MVIHTTRVHGWNHSPEIRLRICEIFVGESKVARGDREVRTPYLTISCIKMADKTALAAAAAREMNSPPNVVEKKRSSTAVPDDVKLD